MSELKLRPPGSVYEMASRNQKLERRREERFHPAKFAGWCRGLTSQADRFAGAKREEKSRPAPFEMTVWVKTGGASPATTKYQRVRSEDRALQRKHHTKAYRCLKTWAIFLPASSV